MGAGTLVLQGPENQCFKRQKRIGLSRKTVFSYEISVKPANIQGKRGG